MDEVSDFQLTSDYVRNTAVSAAVAKAMNLTSTNPTPQAQFLASTAAKVAFDNAMRIAHNMVGAIMPYVDSDIEHMEWYLAELETYIERGPDE